MPEEGPMMEFCPPNSTLTFNWINHGLSECFMDTVTQSVISGFILLFGIIQLYFYRKYATQIIELDNLPRSRLFQLQIFFTVFIPILSIVRFILQSGYYDNGKVYGYMVLTLMLTIFAYPFSIVLIMKERHYLLPSVPTRGHGIGLLIFWTLIFITENLAFINLKHEEWWFNLKT